MVNRSPACLLAQPFTRVRRICAAAAGFSLQEMLMYMSLSALVLWFTVSLVLSGSRSNNTMMRSMRLMDRWSRLSMLMESEIAEGMQIGYDTSLPVACGGGSADVVVNVTVPYLTALNAVATTTISYFSRDRELYRCGPTYQDNGRLRADQALVVSLLSNRTLFSVDRSSSTSQDPARALRYSIQFLDASNAPLLSRTATARTRVSPIQ